jgi:hypothetical protein
VERVFHLLEVFCRPCLHGRNDGDAGAELDFWTVTTEDELSGRAQ